MSTRHLFNFSKSIIRRSFCSIKMSVDARLEAVPVVEIDVGVFKYILIKVQTVWQQEAWLHRTFNKICISFWRFMERKRPMEASLRSWLWGEFYAELDLLPLNNWQRTSLPIEETCDRSGTVSTYKNWIRDRLRYYHSLSWAFRMALTVWVFFRIGDAWYIG